MCALDRNILINYNFPTWGRFDLPLCVGTRGALALIDGLWQIDRWKIWPHVECFWVSSWTCLKWKIVWKLSNVTTVLARDETYSRTDRSDKLKFKLREEGRIYRWIFFFIFISTTRAQDVHRSSPQTANRKKCIGGTWCDTFSRVLVNWKSECRERTFANLESQREFLTFLG